MQAPLQGREQQAVTGCGALSKKPVELTRWTTAMLQSAARTVRMVASSATEDVAMKTGIWLLLVGLTVLAAGCGSSGSTSAGQPSSSQSTTAATSSTIAGTTTATPTIVGRWKRVNKCPQLVKALDNAGLGAIAPAVVGDYFPGINVKQLAQKDDLCEGAKPFVHYHFFDDAGRFGSLDENENQVDDGNYEIIDSKTFRIGSSPGVVFHNHIQGDTMTLSPVLTPAMTKQALAHPLDFSDAGWAIAVTYPGEVWKRVSCGNWC